jgi:hypothetical protein
VRPVSTVAAMTSPEVEPVGPVGIMIFKGSTFSIHDFKISIGDDGEVTSTMRPMIAWEIWPLWLRVAIDHEAAARAARQRLTHADGQEHDQLRPQLIEEETRAGMVTISAVAFALEAIALSAARHADLVAGIGRNASTSRRIAEVIKQCFVVPPAAWNDWRDALIKIFEFRNEATHHDAKSHDPIAHPAVRAGVPRPAVVYRLENATNAVHVALWTAVTVLKEPRPRLGKAFREKVAAWGHFADELREHSDDLRTASIEPVDTN